MKTALIVIGLKIAEVLGVAIIFTLFSLGGGLIANTGNFWLNGFYGIATLFIIIFGGGFVIFGLAGLIKKNIEWAKRLGGK